MPIHKLMASSKGAELGQSLVWERGCMQYPAENRDFVSNATVVELALGLVF
jgi:hypothetical protein